MATYKLEIQAQFGKLQHRVYEASAKAPDYTGSHDGKEALAADLATILDGYGLGEGDDTIIFRGTGFDDFAELREEVRKAPY